MDWVVRIDYNNGTGSGNVVWRLGKDGDFTFNSSDPYPWFSHQHDSGYDFGTTQILSVFDNGNTRVAQLGSGNSRGQVLRLNESNMTATLLVNADLGTYSGALGSAAGLENGNFHFTSGFINGPGGFGQSVEVLPSGVINYNQQAGAATYRSYRVTSMYAPLNR
jgi:hypothetical protein